MNPKCPECKSDQTYEVYHGEKWYRKCVDCGDVWNQESEGTCADDEGGSSDVDSTPLNGVTAIKKLQSYFILGSMLPRKKQEASDVDK